MHSSHRLARLLRGAALAVVALVAPCPKAQAQTGLSFFPLTPCRLWDTRNTHPPAIPANSTRSFVVKGTPCGVPAGAQAIAINVTIVSPTDTGNLRLFPSGTTPPLASLLNWVATDFAVANGTLVRLGADASGNHLSVRVDMPTGSTGQVHVVGDVTGYFQP